MCISLCDNPEIIGAKYKIIKYISQLFANRYANPLIIEGQIKLYEAIANELDYKWNGIQLQRDRRASRSVDILEIQSNFMLSAAGKFSVRRHISFRSRLLSHSKASRISFWCRQILIIPIPEFFTQILRRFILCYCNSLFSQIFITREERLHIILTIILECSNFNEIHDTQDILS